MNEKIEQQPQSSHGRIEIAPEVVTTIARYAVEGVPGVARLGHPSSDGRIFRRSTRHDGVLMHHENGSLVFDIYVLLRSDVNMMEVSRKIQVAVVEAIDKMVGLPVNAVNIHVEDVTSIDDREA